MARCPSSFVARSTPTTSTPVAIGSSVPACPTLRVPSSRRTRPTTPCDVSPEALSTTRTPEGAPERSAGRVVDLDVGVLRVVVLVRVGLARVRRTGCGLRDPGVALAGGRQGLVELSGGVRDDVGDEGQRRRELQPELLAHLGTDEPGGGLQRR